MPDFNETVAIDGSQDEVQLIVEGNATQTQPLQQWQDNNQTELARVTGDGRWQIGSFSGGEMATDDALIEAHRSETDSSKPKRGLHLKGALSGALSSLVTWVMHELHLSGSSGISAAHTALRVKLDSEATGTMTGAVLHGAQIEVENTGGSSSQPVPEVTGLRIAVATETANHTATARGLEVVMDANATTAYALDTSGGQVRFGNLDAGVVRAASDGLLSSGTLTSADIGDNTITNAQLADNAVNTAEIANSAVTNAKLADNAVTNAKLADDAVNTAELVNGAVTSVKLADNAVTNAKLADNAVNTAELVNGAVTLAKLASGTAGKVIGFDGSGNPAEVTIATARKIALLQDRKTSGTGPAGVATGAWYTRELNTIQFDPDTLVAALSSNQFTLAAGTYLIKATSSFHGTRYTQLRLYNATDSAVVDYGENAFAQFAPGVGGFSDGFGEIISRLTITGSKAFRIEYRCTEAVTLGLANGFGTVEIYTQVLVEKLA